MASALVWSLNPCYDPQNAQPLAGRFTGTGSPGHENQASHSLPVTALAARAIAACANLPPEINQALDYLVNLANLVAAGRVPCDQSSNCPEITSPENTSPMLASNENSCHAETEKRTDFPLCDPVHPWQKNQEQLLDAHGRVPEPGTHKKNALTTKNTKDKPEKAPQSPGKQHNKSTTATQGSGQLPNTTLALGALVGLCAVVPSSASDSARWIEIPDVEALGKICMDAKYPCSGKYRLISNIKGGRLPHSIGNETNPFTGELDGNCRIVDDLPHCLVKNLKGGHIRDLHFKKANITSSDTAGVAVCEMSQGATISNILVTHSNVTTSGNSAAGIAVGFVDDGKVINTQAVGCNLETSGPCGILESGQAGIGAGESYNSTITQTTAEDCMVKTCCFASDAGIGVGYSWNSIVTDTKAIKCTVKTKGKQADAGIGAGYNQDSIVTDTEAVNCMVETSGNQANAGIGAGKNTGMVTNTTAVNCNVQTSDKQSHAGIGAGNNEGSVARTTVINSNVNSTGKADIMGGVDPDICNVRVNNIPKNNTDKMKCSELLKTDFCKNVDPRLAKPDCQAPDTLYGTDASLTCPVAFTTPTPVASSGTATIAGIAVGALFFVAAVGVIGVYAYRLYQRSATDDGGNRPMPGSEPGPERPEHHYDLPVSPEPQQELLSVRQENNATPPPRGAYYNPGQQHPDCPIYESLSSGYLHIFDEDKTPIMVEEAGMTPRSNDSTVAVINIS